MSRRWSYLMLILTASGFSASAAWAAPAVAPADSASAAETITRLHATLIDNMKRGIALGCAGRSQSVTKAVDADFDLPFIGQRVLRKHWEEISDAQRQQFMIAFREGVISTYAARFSRYNGEAFTTLDSQMLATGESIVHAKLKTGGDSSVAFDYVLHQVDGSWRLINVVADGVSDLALRSSQYDSIYKDRGFDGLLAWIQDQNKKMQADCS